MNLVIIDYGSGNLRSVENAFKNCIVLNNFKFEDHLKTQVKDFSKEEFDKNISDNKVVKEKLDQGINLFIKDTNKLMEIILKRKRKIEKSINNL